MSNPPAAARVVAREEITISGAEEVGIKEDHFVVSFSTWVLSLGAEDEELEAGGRRDIVVTEEICDEGSERRVVRMWLPVIPVEPRRSVAAIVANEVDSLRSASYDYRRQCSLEPGVRR